MAPSQNDKRQKRIESRLMSVRGCSGFEWCVRGRGEKERETKEREEKGFSDEPRDYIGSTFLKRQDLQDSFQHPSLYRKD